MSNTSRYLSARKAIFSPDAVKRGIEEQFLTRLLGAEVTPSTLSSPVKDETEDLMARMASGEFDEALRALKAPEPSAEPQRFDDVQPFDYARWASRSKG
jgi:hypothetical protein